MSRKIYLVIVALLLLIIAGCWWQIRQFAATPLLIRQDTIFVLPAGTGRKGLAAKLIKQKIIPESVWFDALLTLEPALAKFKAGTYRLKTNMSVRQLLALLVSGKEAQFPARFPEGIRLQEWMRILRSASWLRHTLTDDHPETVAKALGLNENQPLEGWLWPDTYLYTASTTDVALLRRAHEKMVRRVDEIWQNRAPDLPWRDRNELITMASIIEKETANNAERRLVASVFINRLRAGMRLQTDPSVIYGLGDKYSGTLSRSDLMAPSAWNTYLISGLPPGPIAMPGYASLAAAAHPEKSDYLYFVADGKGGHTFTTNLASHNRAVQAWRQALKEKNER